MKITHALLADPTVYQINRMDAVSSHGFYADEKELKLGQSSWLLVLMVHGSFTMHLISIM